MKKFLVWLIVFGVFVAFAGMSFAKNEGAIMQGKKTIDIATKKADRADAVSWDKKDIAFGIVFADRGHISVSSKKDEEDRSKTDTVIIAAPIDRGAAKKEDEERLKTVDTAAEAVLAYTTDLADSSCIIVAHIVDITGKSKGGAAYAATFVPGVVQIVI